jgi:hypothetical protein
MLFTSLFATLVLGAAAVPTSNIVQYVAAAPSDVEGSEASPIVEITTPFLTIDKRDDAVGGLIEKRADFFLYLWENVEENIWVGGWKIDQPITGEATLTS